MGTPAALPAVEPPVELEAVSCCDLKSEFELVYLLPQMLARLLSQTMRTMTHYQQPNDKEPVHPKHPRTALVMECIALVANMPAVFACASVASAFCAFCRFCFPQMVLSNVRMLARSKNVSQQHQWAHLQPCQQWSRQWNRWNWRL